MKRIFICAAALLISCNRLETRQEVVNGLTICLERDFNWYNDMVHDWHEMPCNRGNFFIDRNRTQNTYLMDQHMLRSRGVIP